MKGAAPTVPGPLATGPRLALRPLAAGDEGPIARFLRVPEVRRALLLGATVPGDEAALAAALVAGTDEGLVLGIAAIEDGRLLGLGGLHGHATGARQAELGLLIGDPADWNRGYGTEATRLLVGLGFRTLGLDRIRLEVHDDHAAAIRAYERAGFRRDLPPLARGHGAGTVGRPRRLVSMSVLRSEWPPPGSPG